MAAATQTVPALLTMEEYLRTAYHPDCDFVDDHLEERIVGETQHGLLQAELTFWFRSHKTEWKIRVLPELRTRVAPSRVRIPDVSVVSEDAALKEQVRTTPPLIAIEILSPEDRLHRVIVRLDDYLQMGIQHIWLLDAEERIGYTYTAAGLKLVDTTRLLIPNTPIYLDLPELFASLD